MADRFEDLDDLKENLAYDIEEMEAVRVPRKPDAAICEMLVQLSTCHRRYAIVLLLNEADEAGFATHLRRSAQTKHKLVRLAMQDDDALVRYLAAGDASGFFCALAAHDLDLARSLTAVAGTPFDADYEFLEDHVYARFLYALLESDFVFHQRHEALLQEFLQAVEGDPTARYTLCRALGDKRVADWRAGLLAFIDEHEAWYAKKGEGLVYDTEGFSTEQFVSIEGLALLHLGEAMGLKVDDQFKYMPRLP